MRAFIALSLPDSIRDRLETLQDDLTSGRPADPETFHITLAFLGEQPDAAVEAAHEALERLRAPALTLRLDGLDLFGERLAPVLAVRVERSEALAALHHKVRHLLHGAGIMPDRDRFRPHVSIARFARGTRPEPAFLNRHVSFGTAPFAVTTLVLYRSVLTRDRAIYEPLADYPLGPGAGAGR